MRVEHAVALGLVERVEHILADVDAEQRRHRDEDVAVIARAREVAQEQRAQQRRDVRAVGIGVGEDADLAVAQARQIVRAGIDAEGDGDVVHFLRGEHLGRIDLPRVQDLAAQRHDRLELAVARLLRGAAGRIAFDEEQLGDARGSWFVQSASLPGSAGPAMMLLALDLLRLPSAGAARCSIASCAISSPVSGCWFSQSENASCVTPATNAGASREESRSLVCPENCGSVIFSDSTKLTPSQTSSGASLMPRGSRLRNSQNSRIASVRPVRKPLTCVPPCGGRDQVHVALGDQPRRRRGSQTTAQSTASRSPLNCADERQLGQAVAVPAELDVR